MVRRSTAICSCAWALVSDLDPYGQGGGDQNGGDEMYLVLEPDSAGYVVIGPTLRLLATVHPRLPVTFFDLFTHALNRWVRVYDYRDAARRELSAGHTGNQHAVGNDRPARGIVAIF